MLSTTEIAFVVTAAASVNSARLAKRVGGCALKTLQADSRQEGRVNDA